MQRKGKLMEYRSGVNKIRITKVVSGIKLVDDQIQESVCSSKNRCILGFLAEGRQVLMNENELVKNYSNGDGTQIRLNAIVPGKVYTVYPRYELVGAVAN